MIFDIEDYSNASPWERSVAAVERLLRQWGLSQGCRSTTSSIGDFEIEGRTFSLEYRCLRASGPPMKGIPQDMGELALTVQEFSSEPLELYFGLSSYLCLHSSAELSEGEANMALGTLLLAAQNCQCSISCFVHLDQCINTLYRGRLGYGAYSVRYHVQHAKHTPSRFHKLDDFESFFRERTESFDTDLQSLMQQFLRFHVCLTYDQIRFPYRWRDFTLDGAFNAGGVVWGPPADSHVLKGFSLVSEWPDFEAGAWSENAMYSDFGPMEAPLWKLKATFAVVETDDTPLAHALGGVLRTLQFGSHALSSIQFALKLPSDPQSAMNLLQSAGFGSDAIRSLGSTYLRSALSLRSLQEDAEQCFAHTTCPSITLNGEPAPGSSLLSRFALRLLLQATAGMHAYDLRQICHLWDAFVQQLRQHWEQKTPLPHMHNQHIDQRQPDLGSSVLNQKMELLQMCILESGCAQHQPMAREDVASFDSEFGDTESLLSDGDLLPVKILQNGSEMIVPATQRHPPVTTDVLLHQQKLLSSLGSSKEASLLRAELQGASLMSDMSAFKADNPSCTLIDFVHWYSPNDVNTSQQPYQLSDRMADPDNLWNRLWNKAVPCAAADQQPLFDNEKEAELALDFLSTMSPHELFDELSKACLSSALHVLLQANKIHGTALQHDSALQAAAESLLAHRDAFTYEQIERQVQDIEIRVSRNAGLGHALEQCHLSVTKEEAACLLEGTLIPIRSIKDRKALGPLFFNTETEDNLCIESERTVVGYGVQGSSCHRMYMRSTSEGFTLATAVGSLDW